MKRKLEVARCLLIEPSYIMLDEPFAGVDPVAISDIKRMLLDLKKKTSVYSSPITTFLSF